MIEKESGFIAGDSSGKVSVIFLRPEKPRWLLVFAHGASAGIRQAFMSGMAQHLAEQGIASFRSSLDFRSMPPENHPANGASICSKSPCPCFFCRGRATHWLNRR
jgi:predicted alpha/beta-hydrolase family hydrolase